VADPRPVVSASPVAGSPPLSVAALTRGLERGDEAAYRALHAAYFDRLLRYLLVVARGDEHAAREALQATFLRVTRHARLFTEESHLWSWLTVLARSALSDQRRGRRRYLAFLDRFTRHSAATNDDTAESPARTLDNPADQLGTLLEAELARIPVEDRALLEWKYRENQTVRTIADRLDTSEKAVESRLSRLRARIKTDLLARLRESTP
jgi:RNA polymerase sigma factor (sigma-70 family)